jgi:hypothetical protein
MLGWIINRGLDGAWRACTTAWKARSRVEAARTRLRHGLKMLRTGWSAFHDCAERGAPVIGRQWDARVGKDGPWARLALVGRRGPLLGLACAVNPAGPAATLVLGALGRAIEINAAAQGALIPLAEWFARPDRIPGLRLTELWIADAGTVRWHILAGRREISAYPPSRPGWRRGEVDLAGRLFGPRQVRTIRSREMARELVMPEGTYPVRSVRATTILTRPGLGDLARTMRVVELRCDVGVPLADGRDATADQSVVGGDQKIEWRFVAATTDVQEALAWWRSSLLARRPDGEAWRPRPEARPVGGGATQVDGVPVWETQAYPAGPWQTAGPHGMDGVPEEWIINPYWRMSPTSRAIAAVTGYGVLSGLAAYFLSKKVLAQA